MKDFCPFIKGTCREDCVFRHHAILLTTGISTCLIAAKLDDIPRLQNDEENEKD